MPEFEVAKMYSKKCYVRVGEADKMQTMCHGDPKGANIMFDEEQGISFYDFQWFGKAPPSKEPNKIKQIYLKFWKFCFIIYWVMLWFEIFPDDTYL